MIEPVPRRVRMVRGSSRYDPETQTTHLLAIGEVYELAPGLARDLTESHKAVYVDSAPPEIEAETREAPERAARAGRAAGRG